MKEKRKNNCKIIIKSITIWYLQHHKQKDKWLTTDNESPSTTVIVQQPTQGLRLWMTQKIFQFDPLLILQYK